MVKDAILERIWNIRLQKALEHPSLHMRTNRVFTAFNAITDAIVHYSRKDFEKLLKNLDKKEILEKQRNFSLEAIENREDFFAAFIEMFSRGKALELPAYNLKLFGWFRIKFKEQIRMGGQAGIVANQLAKLGVNTVCYSPILSKQQARMYEKRNLFTPILQHERLVFRKPQTAYRKDDPFKINWIFEFRKGDKITFNGKTIICPRSNRLIVASRPKEYVPLFTDEFEPHLHAIANSFDVFFLGGFQSFQKRMGEYSFRHYLRKLKWQLTQLRKNQKARFHLEYVAIHDKYMGKNIWPEILPFFDSMGINEVETSQLLKLAGDYHAANELERHESPLNFYKALGRVFHKFKLKRLHGHTLGYFIMLLRKDYIGYSLPERFVNSLLFASRVADSRAYYGKPPSAADLRKLRHLRISETGIAALKSFSFEYFGKKDEAIRFMLNGICDAEDHYIIMVPTAIVKAKATVGLGDTISSTAFVSEPF